MTVLSAIRRGRKTAIVHITAMLPSRRASKLRPVYWWCDWCDSEWDALGARDGHRTDLGPERPQPSL
jgi:hypothetical protein